MKTKITINEIGSELDWNENGSVEYLLSLTIRGREVGCVGAILKKDRSLYIFDLCVDRDFQKKGVATKLLLECDKLAEKLNADSLYLDVSKNSWREGWFRKLGFLDLSENPYDENFLRMHKKIK